MSTRASSSSTTRPSSARPWREVLGETVLDIAPTPNRPDHFSVLGIAREVAALTGQSVREPAIDYAQDGPPIARATSVQIADPDLCGRYVATIIRGIEVRPRRTGSSNASSRPDSGRSTTSST